MDKITFARNSIRTIHFKKDRVIIIVKEDDPLFETMVIDMDALEEFYISEDEKPITFKLIDKDG